MQQKSIAAKPGPPSGFLPVSAIHCIRETQTRFYIGDSGQPGIILKNFSLSPVRNSVHVTNT
jgi:hypothetical protein